MSNNASVFRSGIRRILSGKKQGVREYIIVHAPKRVTEPGLSPFLSFIYAFAAGCMFSASGLVFYDFIRGKLIPDIKSFIREEKVELCPSCHLRRYGFRNLYF